MVLMNVYINVFNFYNLGEIINNTIICYVNIRRRSGITLLFLIRFEVKI